MSSYPPYSPPPPPPPRPSGNRTTLIVIAVVLAVVVGLVGIGLVAAVVFRVTRDDSGTPAATRSSGAAESPAPDDPLPSTDPALATFYGQKLRWSDCDGNECSRLKVPLDYADPAGETISLAVLRVPATQRGKRIGQLVVNPGGPGASGVDYASGGAQTFGSQLARSYDIVGFDPRGVVNSTPLKCLTTEQTDEYISSDPDPDTAAEESTFARLNREFGQACLKRSGDLTAHISTVEAAKDIDILRAALGEDKLDYLGASYGTFLGSTYADLFPTHVGRMVLDGAVDPALSNEELTRVQAKGFQTALRAYLEDCVSQGDCPLGDSADAGAKRLREFLDELDAKPLPTGTDRELTEGLGVYGVILPLYVKDFWPALTDALRDAFRGDGAALLEISDQYNDRGANGYNNNSAQTLLAINCLDHGDATPLDQVQGKIAEFEQVSPTFGRFFAYGLSACSSWPVGQGNKTVAPRAAGAPPIVVIGTTRDPATPYEMAVSLASELESGRLITRDGDGHTGFRMGNSCVDDAVQAFLLRGTPPREDLRC